MNLCKDEVGKGDEDRDEEINYRYRNHAKLHVIRPRTLKYTRWFIAAEETRW